MLSMTTMNNIRPWSGKPVETQAAYLPFEPTPAIRESGIDVRPGKGFGRLTVLGWQFRVEGVFHVVAECECGVIKIVSAYNLKHGRSHSCGCSKQARPKREPSLKRLKELMTGTS